MPPLRAIRTAENTRGMAAAAALVTVCLWASAFVGIRDAVSVYRPADLALLRFLFASAAFGMLCLSGRIRVPAAADLLRLGLSGAIGIAVYHLCLNTGTHQITAGSASFLTNTVPVWTALLAAAFLHESIPARSWLGIVLAFAGTSVLGWGEANGPGSGQAVALVLVAALAQSIYFVLQKPLLGRYRPLEAVAYAVWAGTLCLLPFGSGLIAAVTAAPAATTAIVAYLGVGPGALAYVLWAHVLAGVPAGRAASVLFLVPLVTVLIGWLWLREVPSRAALVGGAATLAGVALAQAGLIHPRRAAAAPGGS